MTITPSLSAPSPADVDRLSMIIDLDAIIHNWRQFMAFTNGKPAAPVIKADAYGHGIALVAKALHHAGCELVFTASIEEAVTLATAVPSLNIAYFDGPHPRDMAAVLAHNIIPVVNTPEQCDLLITAARQAERHVERRIPAILHLDTGMNRLGLSPDDLALVFARDDLGHVDWRALMSHLAMADVPNDPMNEAQRMQFDAAYKARPPALAAAIPSLSATGGVMLGSSYHYGLTRPGIGIFGMAPMPDIAPEMTAMLQPTLRLESRVLQIRAAASGESVGYGQYFKTRRPSRLATIGGGYADGILRQLSNQSHWMINGHKAPIVGRVSMDVHVIDITELPDDTLMVGDKVKIITTGDDIHDIAKKTDTIAHDVLTRLGLRAKRHYAGDIVSKLNL